MNYLTLRVKDWWILGPRMFYKKYMEGYFQRMGSIAMTDDHGYLTEPLPLGYHDEDKIEFEAKERKLAVYRALNPKLMARLKGEKWKGRINVKLEYLAKLAEQSGRRLRRHIEREEMRESFRKQQFDNLLKGS